MPTPRCSGAGNGLTCGLDFFGADRVVFATDAPLGPIAKTIAAVDRLGLDPAARRKIMVGNAERLLNKPLSYSLPVYATAGAASGRPGHFAICVSTISADTTTNSASAPISSE